MLSEEVVLALTSEVPRSKFTIVRFTGEYDHLCCLTSSLHGEMGRVTNLEAI